MAAGWLGGTFALALVDWLAVHRSWRWVEYVAKPATLLVLFVSFWWVTGLQGWAIWFGLGLFFSLLGDVFLMLPGERFFMPGLASFLLAHLTYTVALNIRLAPLNWLTLLLAALVIVAAVILYRRILTGLVRRSEPAVVRTGVLIYSLAISLMVFSALLCFNRPGWSLLPAVFVSLGGVLFFASDSILALNRFVAPISRGHLWVMITYHAGQIALAYGMAAQLLSSGA